MARGGAHGPRPAEGSQRRALLLFSAAVSGSDNPIMKRLELLYENGDYSLIDAQAMHILRKSGSTRDVRLVRTQRSVMRFPRLP